MSGIDVGAILKSLGGGGSGDLMGGLQSLLQGSGGLGGLLSQLQGSGLGDQVESWITSPSRRSKSSRRSGRTS
jgi:uncharacterized protein YidB (DUF937 family)